MAQPSKQGEGRARTEHPDPLGPDAPPACGLANQQTPDLLSSTQQHILLQYLLKGASPYAACQQLDLPIAAYLHTLRTDDTFRRQTETVYTILAQNVLAAFYHAAIKGNVSAQSFWLKSNPPPGWQTEQPVTNQPHTFDDFFDKLSDHELLELARAMGLDLSPETERALFGQSSPQQPESIPQ